MGKHLKVLFYPVTVIATNYYFDCNNAATNIDIKIWRATIIKFIKAVFLKAGSLSQTMNCKVRFFSSMDGQTFKLQ